MCGRYASSRRPEALVEEFEVVAAVREELRADWNVAPTKKVYAIVARAEAEGAPALRSLSVARWGLIPSWAKDPSIGSRMINARLETVIEKPSFKRAFASRRCLMPADGYYEWYTQEVQGGKPRKQPFYIHRRDGASLAMAAIFEVWRDPTKLDDDPNAFVTTTSAITTAATADVSRIHDRMPQFVVKENWEQWLDPTLKDPQEALSLLTPTALGTLEAYPVSTAVNVVRNNGEELITPIPFDEEPETLL